MPRGAGRTGKRRGRTVDTPTESVTVVEENHTPLSEGPEVTTTETATETTTSGVPNFLDRVRKLPEDYSPDRSPVGRSRTPSQFEAVMPEWKDQGWMGLPHDGQVVMEKTDSDQLKATPDSVKKSDAHVIVRELRKAQQFLGLGMDLNITDQEVQFRIRDLQKRKAKEGEQADADGNVVDEATDTAAEYDNGEDGE